MTGITRFTTGFPVSLYQSGDPGLIGSFGAVNLDEPDYNGQGIHFTNPRASGLQYFSPSQFSPMPVGEQALRIAGSSTDLG